MRYEVTCDTRGREVYRVEASSPTEAVRLVENGAAGEPVASEVLDMEVETVEEEEGS